MGGFEMKTGIAIFAYNRNIHLEKMLNGLKQNKEVTEIYVFQDGLKTEKHREGWEATRKVISDIDWCKVSYIQSEENKGVAHSIVDGINYVLKENDTIVVLEDDCVPAPDFIKFMLQSFDKYEKNKDVYCISGYSWPIDVEKDEYDAYFTGRTSSWGWGTWKDRWDKFEFDNSILDKIIFDEKKSEYLAIWGKDLEGMLKANIAKTIDAWDVYWSLKVIELNGKCLTPYVSLIQNIGCDGSGMHCGVSDRISVKMDCDRHNEFFLPSECIPRKEAVRAFTSLYGSYTASNYDNTKKNVIVYGLGRYFMANEQYINENYYISAFIDRAKEGYYAGKKIINLSQLNMYDYESIVIMMQNINECLNVAKMLINDFNVNEDKIMIIGASYKAWKNKVINL
jgi:hypothetical protein